MQERLGAGVTLEASGAALHGLRHKFVANESMVKGLLPHVLGGLGQEMSGSKQKEVMQVISNQLGHGKTHTVGAHFGTFRELRRKVLPGHGALIGSFVLRAEKAIVGSLFVTPRVSSKLEGGCCV